MGGSIRENDMTMSLYGATVPAFQQMLGAVSALLAKAEAHCTATGHDPAALVNARLTDDMLPLGYQVKSVTSHSIKAIEGVRAGVFSPDMSPWPQDMAGLRALLDATKSAIDALTADEVNGFVGRDAAFVMGETRMPFLAEDFLLSFSLPNFYFHATTAYAILRVNGVSIGKRDFLGRPRLKV
jgi:uncharacterized protein